MSLSIEGLKNMAMALDKGYNPPQELVRMLIMDYIEILQSNIKCNTCGESAEFIDTWGKEEKN